jgi:hypothetical protein
MRNRWKRHIALAVSACFILATLLSLTYIAVEADHNCTGEHCSICAHIQSAQQTLKRLGAGVAASAVLLPALAAVLAAVLFVPSVFLCVTPVSQKIRLND